MTGSAPPVTTIVHGPVPGRAKSIVVQAMLASAARSELAGGVAALSAVVLTVQLAARASGAAGRAATSSASRSRPVAAGRSGKAGSDARHAAARHGERYHTSYRSTR